MHPIRQPVLKRATIVLAVAIGLFAPIQTTMAAEDKAKSVPEIKAPPVETGKISDARLKAFAVASSQIMAVRQKYWPQVQAAGTEDEMRKIAAIAQKEMMQAISTQGLTADQYNEVVQAAQKDKSIVDRIKELEKGMKSTKK